jgi:hypothetical protein
MKVSTRVTQPCEWRTCLLPGKRAAAINVEVGGQLRIKSTPSVVRLAEREAISAWIRKILGFMLQNCSRINQNDLSKWKNVSHSLVLAGCEQCLVHLIVFSAPKLQARGNFSHMPNTKRITSYVVATVRAAESSLDSKKIFIHTNKWFLYSWSLQTLRDCSIHLVCRKYEY